MEKDKCPLCQDKRGARWTEALALGNKTQKEAMIAFGMKRSDVEEHIYQHSKEQGGDLPATTELNRSYDKDFYIRRLDQMGSDLNSMLEEVMTANVNSESIRNATTLTKEIRETLRLLGDITKVIKDDNTAELERSVIDMRTNYLTLTNIITTKVCPDCQKKILEAIDTQRKLLGNK
jgi:hypothetical protein